MIELFFIAQTAEPPWWLSAIVGPAGAIVVLGYFAWTQAETIRKKDIEIREITREAIECITKVLDRQEMDEAWKTEVTAMLRQLMEHVRKS